MIHLGDITKINGGEIPPVNIITGGSPCQDLSIAGNRAGLSGERSGLFMEQIRIIKEMHKKYGKEYPRFMVWENVPGAFSSNSGEDFRTVLEETARVIDENASIPGSPKGKWTPAGCILGDGWSIAWRVHDAQFWGVPQRRRRIALVADFGGESAPEILFERKSVPGDPSESKQQGKEIAGNVGSRIDSAISFQERAGKPGGGKGILIQNERTGALSTLNNQSVAYGIFKADGNEGNQISFALVGDHNNRVTDMTNLIIESQTNIFGSEILPTLIAGIYKGCGNTQDGLSIITYGLDRASYNQGANAQFDFNVEEEKIAPLISRGPGAVCCHFIVRRLTPLECERLQGFPDGWTNVGISDAQRYKMLGNSIALPFWQWMAFKMVGQYKTKPSMGSLFDGIGGFPLVFKRAGCSPVWASEIDPYCIEVTTIRFNDK